MKFSLCVLAAILLASSQFAFSEEPDLDGKQLDNQLGERAQKINTLTTEEQLKLRAAQVKASEDPEVLAAAEKRNKAIEEFRKAMHDSMVKADPKVEEILQKIAVGSSPGF